MTEQSDSPSTRDLLKSAIDRATAGAGPVMKVNFVDDEWVMSVHELEAFWQQHPVAGFCTVSSRGKPHVVPIEPELVDGTFTMSTFANAVRISDLRSNSQAALISWSGPWEVVVVYGKATIEPGEAEEMVTVRLVPSRIYCIRPPAWHHAAKA
ncbi:MAG: pyridoxamine 5'-phosphate oxidase family protein [Dehalococcoidia bacterium]